MLSPHLSVEPHEEGVAIRVRHCMLVVPPKMARELAELILLRAVEVERGAKFTELPEAQVVGEDGKPTKVRL